MRMEAGSATAAAGADGSVTGKREWRLRMMREAGVYCEVEPRHLFNTLLPAAYLLQPGPRPNIVPDARTDVR